MNTNFSLFNFIKSEVILETTEQESQRLYNLSFFFYNLILVLLEQVLHLLY